MSDHAELIRRLLQMADRWELARYGDLLPPRKAEDTAQLLRDAASQLAGPAREAQCPTHGDPLVCLACEADENARPEWRAAPCVKCGGLPPGEASGSGDLCYCDSPPSPSPTAEPQG